MELCHENDWTPALDGRSREVTTHRTSNAFDDTDLRAAPRSNVPHESMKTSIVLIAVVGIGLALLIVRSIRARAKRKHDPIEYYRGWGSYRHPIVLQGKITKEEAEAIAAKGSVYLICNFDVEGRLVRVVKMLRGTIFFDFVYEYHANGKLRTVMSTDANGVETVWRYDERGRGLRGNPSGFW